MTRETFESEFLGAHKHGDKHDSFSDEFQGVPAAARDSFNSEFRGVPDHSFRDERPSGTFDHGRGARRAIVVLVVLLGLFGAGAWAIWYWSEPLGAWLAGLDEDAPPVEPAPVVEPEPVAEPEAPAPAEPPVDKVFGIKGTPDGADPSPVPEPMPVDEPPPTPPTPPTPTPSAGIEVLTTQVRGKVPSAAVGSRLASVDEAVRTCRASTPGPIELELRLSIKWNGKAQGISISGGDEALQRCVKQAVPLGGWPQPSDGGEASVVRRWKLG